MESLANFIIRPKRAEYNPSNDLGPKLFYLNGMPKQRIDFEITNPRNQKLKCSLFAPSTLKQKFPCVVYCHGNSACRVEALEIVDLLLPHDIIIAALDFSGSGLSEGDYVTLGYNENNDLGSLVEYLRNKDYISDIGLWGRSMGAVTSILFAAKDHNIACMCLDSAFSNLPQLCIETLKNRTLGSFFGGMFMGSVRKTIKKKADFELDDVSPIDCISHCKMPALFIHGRKDTIVSISHSQKLFSVYPGSSKIHEIETEHNDPRPKWVKQEIKNFFVHKFAEIRKKKEFNETINSVLGEKLTNHKGNTRLEDFLNKMTYHDDEDSPPSSPPKEQFGLNLGSLKGSYENPSPMTDRSNRGETQVATASIEAIVGNKLFMMMKKDADEAKKKKKKYADESDSDDDDIPPFIKNKDRSGPKFVPFGKGAQALFDLKFKNGSFHNPRKVRNDSFSELPKGYHKKFAAHEYNSDGEM